MTSELSSQKTTTRRERHFQRHRKEIMDAAAHLFAGQGYAATTTKDIALAADIGESTLYGYFPGKRDILVAILSQKTEMIDSFFTHINQVEDRQGFLDLLDAMMERVLANAVYIRALIAEAWVNDQVLNDYVVARLHKTMQSLETFVSDKVAQGIFRPIDPRLGARVFLGTFFAVVLPQLRGVEPLPSPEQRRKLAETVIALLLDGFAVHRDTGGKP